MVRRGALLFCTLTCLMLASCSKPEATGRPDASTTVPAPGAEARIVFRDADGHTLTEQDMARATGTFDWSVVGDVHATARARELHEMGREEGQRGNYSRALGLFKQASEAAPLWPYPVYDAAFTHLLRGDTAEAEHLYRRVDQMAPRGFFTAKTAVDCLRRERAGDLKPGTYQAYVSLEWVEDREQKRTILEQVVKAYPRFPAAWKELAVLRPDDVVKLDAIERGLSENPDGETKGVLLINKAIILDRQGQRDAATRILGDLALDPQSTLATESLARFTLRNMLARKSGQAATPSRE